MAKILVTGASGFIGRALCGSLIGDEHQVISVVRSDVWPGPRVLVEDIADFDGWRDVLDGIDVVVHLAGRAHILKESARDPLTEFRRVNTQATVCLAQNAAAAKVKRFVFISSIAVNGSITHKRPFSNEDVPQPDSHYGLSKFEAELALQKIAASSNMEVVVIRPPLVYGYDAPGNFGSLLRWLRAGIPLPLGAVTGNRRSFISLDNLVDVIITCLKHPAAAGQTFLVSDGEDVSTTELLHRTARAMGRNARLVPVPAKLLEFCARLLGRQDLARRLCGSLQVDIEKTRRLLDWQPPLTLDQGLKKAVEGMQP